MFKLLRNYALPLSIVSLVGKSYVKFLSNNCITNVFFLSRWSIWYLRNDRAKMWTDRLTRVKSVATVEEFWSVINYTTPASKITVGCEYYLFKSNIQPMWEDPANRNGGRWVTVLDKSLRFTRLDHYWLETLLLLIGEGFGDFSETVCGAVVQLRGKGDKLSIWTSHYDDEEAVRSVGRTWKERLMLKGPISYQKHEDQQTKSSSMLKSLFTL